MSATVDRLMDVAESDMRLRGYHAVSFRDLAEALLWSQVENADGYM